MSSILKALQKLEQEKATRRKGAPDVAKDIVKPAGVRQRPSWLVPAVTAGVTLLAVLMTYTFMGGFTRHKQSPAVVAPPAVPQPAKVAPVAAPVTASPELTVVPPLPPVSTDLKHKTPTAPPPPARATLPQTAPPARTAAPQPPPPVRSQAAPPEQLPATPIVTPKVAEPAAAPSPAYTPLPTLKVTGIAWQKDNSSRLAVINGSTVAEGGTVEGARVEEIYPDRVRFTVGKRGFEVPLGKSSADR